MYAPANNLNMPEPKSFITLHSVAGVPVQGMVSSVDAASLADGQWSLLQNVSWDTGAIKVRGGLTQYRSTQVGSGTSTLPSGTVVGAYTDKVDGDFVAINTGAAVKFYKFVEDGTTNWFDVTSGTFTVAATDKVWFEVFTIPGSGLATTTAVGQATSADKKYIIAQNGYDRALMAVVPPLTGAFSFGNMASLSPHSPSATKATPFALDYLSVVGTVTLATSSNTTTTWASTTTLTSVGKQYISLNVSTATAAGNTVTVQFSDTAALSTTNNAAQMQIIYNQVDQYIWDSWQVELGTSGGTYYAVHIPGVTRPQTAVTGDRFMAAMFDLSTVSTSTGTSATSTTFVTSMSSLLPITFDRLRFVWRGSTPGAASSSPFYAVAFGAGVPFGTQFAVTNFADTVESPPTVAENQIPPTIREVGGTPMPGVTLAASPFAKYRYTVATNNVTAADQVLCYVKEPGKTKTFTLLLTEIAATSNAIIRWNVDTIAYGKWTMPPVTVTGVPNGGPMCMSGDRLYVAQISQTGTAASRSVVAFSEKRMPNRFYFEAEVIDGQVQPRSGGSALFGNETVNALMPQAGGIYSGDGVLSWTEKAVYQMSGVDAFQIGRPNNLGAYGCTSPGSVARIRDTVVWVTPGRQVMAIGGDLGSLSSRQVEDFVKSVDVGRWDNIESVVFNDKLYICYSPTGETVNRKALVWDARTQGWCSHLIGTTSGASFAKWAKKLVGADERLLCFDASGWMFEYDNLAATGDRYVTATTVALPTIKLTSRCLSKDFHTQIRLGDVIIASDDMGDGSTWTTRLIERQSGTTYSGVLNMDGDGSKIWRLNRGTTEKERVGAMDTGIQVEIEGDAAPGKAIYSIGVEELGVTEHGADRK